MSAAALAIMRAMAWDARSVAAASVDDFVLRRKRMVRELREAAIDRTPLRIAVLGGSTTQELVGFLEPLLLGSGFDPVFHQGDYGRFYEEAVLDVDALLTFRPDVVYLHTSYRDVMAMPTPPCSEEAHAAAVQVELQRYREIWRSLHDRIGCQVIQNNFEAPPTSLLGHLDGVVPGGATRFLRDLNAHVAAEAQSNAKLLLQDLQALSARVGVSQWFDWNRWYTAKMMYTPDATLAIARSLNAMLCALYGRSRKVLVLDLDNTLWGGVIGDDGIDGIHLGRETPLGEAYIAFQEYCVALRQRGILLAVCSKNDDAVARSGFAHPSSVLKLEDFAAFRANWEPKHENLVSIADELSLGLDSFVFVDDNPAERAIVAAQLPTVAVPDVGDDVSRFIPILDAGRFFEPASLSGEDFARATMYAQRAEGVALQGQFANYGEYLDSLEMHAEIAPFQTVYLDRIAQLTNKTNQFNLTTQRCTLAEIERMASQRTGITLYCRLRDRFGDHGLISVIAGRIDITTLHIDLWLMSCRVLKRDVELAMLDALAERSLAAGVRQMIGSYRPTKKNGMVAEHYAKLGFIPLNADADGVKTWTLDLAGYTPRNTHIHVTQGE